MHVELMLEMETDAQLAARFGNNREMREAYEAAIGRRLVVPPAPARKPAAAQLKAKAPAPVIAPLTPVLSPAAIAAAHARAAAQARRDTVLGSSPANGREAYANALLADGNHTAEQIIAALAGSPTDAERAAKVRQAAADAVWDRANGVVAR